MDNRRVLTVSELNGSIRALLESRFPFVSVSGEISNLHRPYSGHLYFTLKDGQSQIRAVLFKMQQRYLKRVPADGDSVLCRGRISVYEPRGEYQLLVDAIDYHGTGALQQAFEQLKRRLAAEGLFDQQLKRPLPRLPQHLTLVTSPQGAAVHDFIRIATRRYPPIAIAVYPVAVQGEQAPGDMIRGLAEINAQVATEAIVLCRGGGSIEDLWAFNDEQLARAIRASALPVVSAVGHEIDFTIADFAADLRAPTPSAAAELLLPESHGLKREIDQCRVRMQRTLAQRLDRAEQRLLVARHRLETMAHPLDRLLLRVDQLGLGLERGIQAVLAALGQRLHGAAARLARHTPEHRLALHQAQLAALQRRLIQAADALIQTKADRFGRAAEVLQAVSPLATLARGYAIVRKPTGQKRIVSDVAQVRIGERVEVLLHHGQLQCRVEGRRNEEGGPDDQEGQSSTASTF